MSERPLLSVIVPTVGRDSLERTVRSLLRQRAWLPWECVLVGDTHLGTFAADLERARRLGETDAHLRFVEHDGGTHAWGHPQRNFGMTVARGHFLSFLGDDDVYLPGAFRAIQSAILGGKGRLVGDQRVFLFRWVAPWKQLLWHTAGFLAQDHIDAECIVCPNVPDKLGVWTNRYQGDYDFIRATVELWGGVEKVIWQPEVIAQAQPSEAEDWTTGGGEAEPVDAELIVHSTLVPRPKEHA